jgi:putative transposase
MEKLEHDKYYHIYNRGNNRENLFREPDNYLHFIYLQTNPVHHGFVTDFKDYPWSSYGRVTSIKLTKLSRDKVLGWFDDKANYIELHKQKTNFNLIEKLIVE